MCRMGDAMEGFLVKLQNRIEMGYHSERTLH